MNVIIIGFGKMGQTRASYLKQLNFIGKIYAHDSEFISKENEHEDIIFTDSPEEIIQSSEVSIVFVCTPNYLNVKYTCLALESNKHVFCEKPAALDLKQLQKVVKSKEKAKNSILMYGFNHRFHESIMKMRSIVESGDLGKIIWMRGRYGKGTDHSFFNGWRSKKELSGGGILFDQGCHMIDLFHCLGANFDKVQSIVTNTFWEKDIEDNVFANLYDSSKNISASLHSTMTSWRHIFSLEVFLSDGYIVLNGLKTSTNSYGEEILSYAKNSAGREQVKLGEEIIEKYDINTSWKIELEHFFESISNNTEPKNGNIADAKKSLQLITKIYDFSEEFLND